MPDQQPKKSFFATTPIVILNLLFIFPLGLYCMWKYEKFNHRARIIITVVILGFFIHASLKRAGII